MKSRLTRVGDEAFVVIHLHPVQEKPQATPFGLDHQVVGLEGSGGGGGTRIANPSASKIVQ